MFLRRAQSTLGELAVVAAAVRVVVYANELNPNRKHTASLAHLSRVQKRTILLT